MSARAIDKALAVIELKNCFAQFARMSRSVRDFDAGTICHPQSVSPPKLVSPPDAATIRGSTVKLVVVGHMVEEDFQVEENSRVVDLAGNPLSRLSQQLQDAHLTLVERDLHPDDPSFFEEAARIGLLKTQLQRLLTKYILQANPGRVYIICIFLANK